MTRKILAIADRKNPVEWFEPTYALLQDERGTLQILQVVGPEQKLYPVQTTEYFWRATSSRDATIAILKDPAGNTIGSVDSPSSLAVSQVYEKFGVTENVHDSHGAKHRIACNLLPQLGMPHYGISDLDTLEILGWAMPILKDDTRDPVILPEGGERNPPLNTLWLMLAALLFLRDQEPAAS